MNPDTAEPSLCLPIAGPSYALLRLTYDPIIASSQVIKEREVTPLTIIVFHHEDREPGSYNNYVYNIIYIYVCICT